MPQTAAGWRIDPPVSVPRPSGTYHGVTAADEPPDDPPGTRLRSHGLCEGPNAEFSVDDPIANSSMLVLPRMTIPARRSLVVIVASYGGREAPRVRGWQGVGLVG